MPPTRPPRPPLTRGEIVMIVAAVVLAVAGAVFWFDQRSSRKEELAAPAPAAPASPALADAGPGADPAEATTAADLTPVGAEGARDLLAAVSPDPAFASWLEKGGDLVRRWVILTDNLAEGVSPRKQLAFLAPQRHFTVQRKGDVLVIAPESYRRYDAFADTIASVDAQALAGAYRRLHAVLEAAYRALGYPGASLDRVTAKALRRIAEAPVATADIAVREQGATFAFVDPTLENQGAVEKHLLRMGPRNTRLIQAKAREIEDALGLGASARAGGAR